MYMEILKGLNQSSFFKKTNNDNFMANRVRTYLKEYFDTVNPKQFSKESLDLNYLK